MNALFNNIYQIITQAPGRFEIINLKGFDAFGDLDFAPGH